MTKQTKTINNRVWNFDCEICGHDDKECSQHKYGRNFEEMFKETLQSERDRRDEEIVEELEGLRYEDADPEERIYNHGIDEAIEKIKKLGD